MGLVSSLIEWFQGDGEVAMPPRAASSVIARGVTSVCTLISELRRQAEERRQAEARRRAEESRSRERDETAGRSKSASASGCRWRRRVEISHPIRNIKDADPVALRKALDELGMFVPLETSKRPPDLHAKTLTFSARLVKYVRDRCNGRGPVVYKRAGIDRKLYSKIVSDNNASVSKQTALQLAIGLQLNRKETEEFIGAAGYTLCDTIPMDHAFLFCGPV